MLPSISMASVSTATSKAEGSNGAIAVGSGTPAGVEDFSAVLQRVSTEMASALRASEAAAVGAIEGKVPAQDAVFNIMEAERKLQHALAVRDKLISGFQEISRMQI